jgi:hypothetical protein
MSGGLRFLPWVRRGVASGLTSPAALGQPLPARGRLAVKVALGGDGSGEAGVTAVLYGPGDVAGLDPGQVVRRFPAPGADSAEPTTFAAIELDAPELPWAFTPAAPDARGALRPWLVLVVVPAQAAKIEPGASKGRDVLTCAASELPDLSESWCWAHAQLIASAATEDAKAILAQEDRTVSRLLAVRRLVPETAYVAALVPAFESGRLAGLGRPPGEQAAATLADAWTPTASDNVELPVYDSWTFRTGLEGDFETLARRLRARMLPDTVGLRPMDISDPGPGLPTHAPGTAGTVLGLEGALRAPYTRPTVWAPEVRDPWRAALRNLVAETGTRLAPPLYGALHAGLKTVPEDAQGPAWLRELNLDPRHRAAAALGTRVVQDNQEALAAAAWDQAAQLREANELLARAQLARAAGEALWSRRLTDAEPGTPFARDVLFALTAPVHDAIGVTPRSRRTVGGAVAASPALAAASSVAFRRQASPRGKLARALRPASRDPLDAPVEVLASASVSPVPPVAPPAGMRSLASLAEGPRLDVRQLTAALIRRAPAWWEPPAVAAPSLPLTETPTTVATAPGTVVLGDRFFMGSADGRLFEHRFADGRWMWRDHGSPPGSGVAQPVSAAIGDRVVVTLRDGRVASRVWDGDRWQWQDHGRPGGTSVASGGATAGNSVWFATTGGELAELAFGAGGAAWTGTLGLPSIPVVQQRAAGAPGAVIAGTSVFVVSNLGALNELWSDGSGILHWSVHGVPPNTVCLPGVGPSMLNSKLFVTTADGRLFERFHSPLGWAWVDHGRPPGGNVVSVPGAAMMDQKLFVRVADGTVAERVWNGSAWVWWSHGNPGTALTGAPGAAIQAHTLFLTSADGRLFARHWNGTAWVWEDHGVPHDSGGQGAAGTPPPPDTARWAPPLGLLSSVVVAHIDNPAGANRAYHRVGRDLDLEARPRGGWDAQPTPGPLLAAESRGLGAALADVSGSGRPDLVVLAIEAEAGRCVGRYWVGGDVDADGSPATWSAPKQMHAPMSADVQGADLAIADLDGDGRPELIVAYVVAAAGRQRTFYRVGWSLDRNGDVTEGWSESKEVPDITGTVRGVGVAVADMDDDDRPDLVMLTVEDEGSGDVARYRIGRRVNRRGNVVGGWTAAMAVGGPPAGTRHQGAGLAVADFTGTRRPDLLVLLLEDGPTDNQARYRLGFDVDPDGTVRRWSDDEVLVPGWFGWENQGAAVAVADIDPALVERRAGMGARFATAAQAHQGYLAPAQALARAGRPATLDLTATSAVITAALDPARTVPARALSRLAVDGDALPARGVGSGHDGTAPDPLRVLLRAISFPQPTYELLRSISQDHILPGVEQVPPDTMTVLRANPAFIESFLVGLNTELSRELLWREFPGDPQTTWFRQFWDVRNAVSAGQPLADVPPIAGWGDAPLGRHATAVGAGGEDALVLLVRGELLRRYPSASVSARRATWADAPGGAHALGGEERLPFFSGWLGPDLLFFGFALTVAEARGDDTDPGWFFVLREQPGAPRFGVDDPTGDPATWGAPPAHWDDLHWGHLAGQANAATARFLPIEQAPAHGWTLDGATYGRNAADMARILFQQPVFVAVHAGRMVPPVDRGWHVTAKRSRRAAEPSERVRALLGEHADGSAWELAVEEIVEAIEHGEFFFVDRGGRATRVVVVHLPDGRRHLRTVADRVAADNLLALPEAPAP